MERTSQKGKINWLLILQGWAMLWVVIGHSVIGSPDEAPAVEKALFDIAYSFHMPLFIFISGYLFNMTRISRGCGYGAIIRDKAVRLLIPGFVFSLLALAMKLAFPGEMDRQASLDFNYLAHICLFPYDNPLRELWFLVTLMWLFVLSPLWKVSVTRDWSAAVTAIVLAVLSFFHPTTEFLCIGRVFDYAIWFYLGILAFKYNVVEKSFIRRKVCVLLCGLALYIVGNAVNPSLTTLGGIIVSIGLALVLDKYLPTSFRSFRNFTYQIFLMGIFAQILVKIMYRYIAIPRVFAYLACLAAGLYIPVVVSKLFQKTKSKFLMTCTGL